MPVGKDDETAAIHWARVRGRLRAEFGEADYRRWLRPLTLASVDANEVRVAAPTRFMRDWVRSHFADRMLALWKAERPSLRVIEIVVAVTETAFQPSDAGVNRPVARPPSRAAEAAPAEAPAAELVPTAVPAAMPAGAIDIDRFGSELNGRFCFDSFVTGKPNEFAFAAARRVAEEPKVPFNPLFLYSGVGLGKTHLMHAIAQEIRKRHPQRRVIYLTAEKFMYHFIRALRSKDTMSFKDELRSVDVLLIDDVQFICGKDLTQEEFFHTFNSLIDRDRQIVLSADKSPSDLEGLQERVRSRMIHGLVADIHPTTYELRLSILQSKAELMGLEVPPKVLEFVAHKITSNVRELEGALNRLVAHAQLVGRATTLDTVQEVLHDLLRANDRRVTIEEIQKRVAEHYAIKLNDMFSPRRARAVARPRQVAMYLAKQLTSRSLPEIGRKFGGRDHTTVMHAVRKVEELRAIDHSLAEDIDLLKRMLEN